MKSKIERLKTEKKRFEDDVVALQGRLVSCEETLCGANKRIWYLKKSNAQLRISCASLTCAHFKDAVKRREEEEAGESQQVMENAQELLATLPTSPYCLSLLHFLIKKLPQKCTIKLFA